MKTYMNYSSIDYFKLSGVDYYKIKDQKKYRKILKILKSIIRSLFRKSYIINKNIDVEFLFFKSQDRVDYNKLFDAIYDQCDQSKIMIKMGNKLCFNYQFLFYLFSNIAECFKYIKSFNFLNGIYIYTRILNYYQIINQIGFFQYRHLVVFSDVQPIENMFVQYSNQRNINTITLQHALYIDYKNMPNINMLNYIDVQSNYLLAWGKSTKELLKSYNPSIKVEICGKALDLELEKSQTVNDLIGVVCDQPMFSEYNFLMIETACEIARRKNMKVAVRLHPQDKEKNYNVESGFINFNISIDKASFILAHTTSMIYEYMIRGYRVYKLRSDVPSNELNEMLKFSNSDELEEKIQLQFDFTSEAKKHIEYIGCDSKKAYNEFFQKLHKIHNST